jgi:G:T/U-mismatch repair DNA glycosylase
MKHIKTFEIHPFVPANPDGKWYGHNNIDSQSTKIKTSWFESENSFGFMPSKTIKCLFLGTFPTWEVVNQLRTNGNLEFFYGSSVNSFWSLLSQISGNSLDNEAQIFSFLDKNNIGISDIVKETERRGQSAADKFLTPIKWNNLVEIKNHYPQISTIICTSGGSSPIASYNKNNLNAAVGLNQMFKDLGLKTFGFSSSGYVKHIKIYDRHNLIWEFDLLNIMSPARTANVSIKGILNRKPDLERLMESMPNSFTNYPPVIRFRILQWSFYFLQNNIELELELKNFVNTHLIQLTEYFNT